MFRKNTKEMFDYKELKTKIFIKSLLMFLTAVMVIILLYNFIFSGHFANTMVGLLTYFLRDYDVAYRVYQQIFRNHVDTYLIIGTVLLFLLILRIYLNSFTKYFSEINKGIDSLVEESTDEVVLSTELSATEKKINYIKHTLEIRKMAAQAAEQRKNDLVMYLAHDIRTPLTSIIGYLNLLSEVPDMPVEQKTSYINITLDKAYHLEKMINEFFEITRYNLQEINIIKEEIDLYYMLVQLSDELSPVLSAKGNTILLNIDENITILGDPDKLARVFNNILKNAANYSYPNTEIIICAEQKEHQVILSFINKGPTIPEAKLSSIFEKFYRLDTARNSNTGGTGLGLAIAKEIIMLHEGTITANSINDTTTFAVTLPNVKSST